MEYRRFIHFFPKDTRVPKVMYQIGLGLFYDNKFKQAVDAFQAALAERGAEPAAEIGQVVERVDGPARQARYQAETDPLFMKAMRDEEDGVTLADWKAAVAAIKTDLPYPTMEA